MYLFSLLAPVIVVYLLSFLDYNCFSKQDFKKISIEFFKGITSFIPVLLYFLIFVKSNVLTYSVPNIFLRVFWDIAIMPYIMLAIWFVLIHGGGTQTYKRDFNSFLIHGLGFIFAFSLFNIFKFHNKANFFILFAKPLLDLIIIYLLAFLLNRVYYNKKNIYIEFLIFLGVVVSFAFIYVLSFLNYDFISLILAFTLFSVAVILFIKFKNKIVVSY